MRTAQGGCDQYDKLEYDPDTGKLRIRKLKTGPDHAIYPSFSEEGFFATCFSLTSGKESIRIPETSEGSIDVKTMHISCQSHTYQPGQNYAGVIIYQYNGKSDWRTANNTHCKSGYIVIQDTDSENVKKWIGKECGQVHGAIYRNAFGESVKEAKVVGEGFAVRSEKHKVEKFQTNSGVFNNPNGSIYHDDRKRMHELSEHCVGKIVEYWKTAGPSWITRHRNFQVKELLEDFDRKPFHDHCWLAEPENDEKITSL